MAGPVVGDDGGRGRGLCGVDEHHCNPGRADRRPREGGAFSQMALSSLAGRAVAAAATGSVGTTATAGSLGGVVTEADPAAATIIVIPALGD